MKDTQTADREAIAETFELEGYASGGVLHVKESVGMNAKEVCIVLYLNKSIVNSRKRLQFSLYLFWPGMI